MTQCLYSVEVPYNTKKALKYNDIILTDDKVLRQAAFHWMQQQSYKDTLSITLEGYFTGEILVLVQNFLQMQLMP